MKSRDMLFKHATVVDGSGRPGCRMDVRVSKGRISGLGDLSTDDAQIVVDASGLAVAPGFIDIHSHADFTLPSGPSSDSLVFQGITSVVCGQCGISSAPLLDETRSEVIAGLSAELYPQPWERWSDFAGYLTYLESLGPGVNVIPLVGHGTIRAGVMGWGAGRAGPAELARMRELLGEAMGAGAWGLSTGLAYTPGSYADLDELVYLTQWAGARDGFYFSHIRSEDEYLLEAISEAIEIGRLTGAKIQISHIKAAWPANWGKLVRALELIDSARQDHVRLAADTYPYLAASQRLASLLPVLAQEGGRRATIERLADPRKRREIRAAMAQESPGRFVDWSRVYVVRSSTGDKSSFSAAQQAEAAGKDPFDWFCDTLIETDLDLMMIMFVRSDDNLRQLLSRPDIMIGTDGTGIAQQDALLRSRPHPRNYGACPRLLGRYVRGERLLSLEEAIRKMSGLPAQWLGLRDRGLIREGFWADLVLFDPDTILDRATFENPHQYPDGVQHVLVNGQFAVRNGELTGARSGAVLRFGR
jgi:N-acyl-D-amino-acid deacylase